DEQVDGRQQHVDDLRRRQPLAAAELLEQVLHGMGDPSHVVEPDHGGGALERVRVAEDRTDQLGVAAALLQLQQLLAETGEPLLGLLGEELLELRLAVADGHWAHPAVWAGASSTSTSSRVATRPPTA